MTSNVSHGSGNGEWRRWWGFAADDECDLQLIRQVAALDVSLTNMGERAEEERDARKEFWKGLHFNVNDTDI